MFRALRAYVLLNWLLLPTDMHDDSKNVATCLTLTVYAPAPSFGAGGINGRMTLGAVQTGAT